MKTDYELLKSPAFWPPLGCKLESVKNHGGLEIVIVRDLLCEDSFTLAVKLHTVIDIYKMLELRRRNLQ